MHPRARTHTHTHTHTSEAYLNIEPPRLGWAIVISDHSSVSPTLSNNCSLKEKLKPFRKKPTQCTSDEKFTK